MKENTTYAIPYPRRRVRRGMLRWLGRALLPLLTRAEVTGLENFPDQGPLLVVGNHIAMMEVVLMVVYTPKPLEMLGAGDIPPPPIMDAIARIYSFIPVNRGNLDRKALVTVLDVLKQGGIVGIFPEGGIWDTGPRQAKRGVAWLSYHAQAPILPIGFGGLEGALNAMLRLQRPRLTMHVGEVLPPVTLPKGVSRKEVFRQEAARAMDAVRALIPPEFKSQQPMLLDERFELHVHVHNAEGDEVPVPTDVMIQHADALCKIFYRPAILRIFARDLNMPVAALRSLDQQPRAIAAAIAPILGYLEGRNPAFFTYRFGIEGGLAMESALRELQSLAQWAARRNCTLTIQPSRRYRVAGQSEEIVEHSPGAAHEW